MDKHIRLIVDSMEERKVVCSLDAGIYLGKFSSFIAYPILFGRLLDLLKNILGEPAKYSGILCRK